MNDVYNAFSDDELKLPKEALPNPDKSPLTDQMAHLLEKTMRSS